MLEKTPKGKLLVIGGAEDVGNPADPAESKSKFYKKFEILTELIQKKKKGTKNIEIITTAAFEPNSVNKMYSKAFKEMGVSRVGFIHVGNNVESQNPEFIKRIKKAHAVLFSGGYQFRLTTTLGGTDILEAIQQRYLSDPDFIVAGTSAGAMALSELMIYGGERNESILNKPLKISAGFGFIHNCVFDTHFTKRGRFGRLTQAVAMNPGCIGVGLGENTALLIKKGNQAECKGSGTVIIIDGHDVGHTNISYAEDGEGICLENLRVHILSHGNGFLFNERQFVPSKRDLRIELSFEKKIKKTRSDRKIPEKSNK